MCVVSVSELTSVGVAMMSNEHLPPYLWVTAMLLPTVLYFKIHLERSKVTKMIFRRSEVLNFSCELPSNPPQTVSTTKPLRSPRWENPALHRIKMEKQWWSCWGWVTRMSRTSLISLILEATNLSSSRIIRKQSQSCWREISQQYIKINKTGQQEYARRKTTLDDEGRAFIGV